MSALSGAWLAVSLLQLVLWAGAAVLGAGVSSLHRRPRAGIIAGLAVAGLLSALAVAGLAIGLAVSQWEWGAEKVVIAAPVGVLASALAAIAAGTDLVRSRRELPQHPLLAAALISAAIGSLLGPVCLLLVGPIFGWPVVLVSVMLWLAGTGVALLVTGHRPRRAVISASAFAGLMVALLALFTVFGPTLATAGASGHHLPGAPPDSAGAVSVADLRETGAGTQVHRFDLQARHQTIELPDGSSYDAVTFGSVPGPELVVTQGELVEVTLTNKDVAGGVTLHWHGYDVPAGDDGVAGVSQDSVAPGESFVYRFVADQVGTYWYHTHQDALSGIVRGLYGALIVLPATADSPPADVTALIHTMSGNTLVGSGAVLTAPAGPTRLRLVNTDQAPRRVALDADTDLIALDGTDLGKPASIPAGTILRIPAGGRADLVVAGDVPTSLRVEKAADSGVVIGGSTLGDVDFSGPEFDVMTAASGSLPAWATGPVDVEATQVLDRLLRLVGGTPRLADTINGAVFPYIQPIEVDEGDVVAVTIVNRSTETHPMHLHGHHMVVLSRNGVAADGALTLDTIDVRPGDTWRVAFVADNPGLWMDHCHNLDHAAAGMVMHVAYRGVTSPFELGGAHGNAPE